VPPRPLIPSRPEADDPAVMSPLFGDISHRYHRGRIIHTLFQFLPGLPEDERLPRAVEWLGQPGNKLNPVAQNEILEATFNVLNDPQFAHIFGRDARAEVPLTGHLKKADGTHAIVSGQVDRLLVSDSQVTVLDYKTNRPAPKTIDDVPLAYKKQMRTYRDILAEIWPGRAIRTALIWTDGPALMDITDAL
jgi:ATP-dependent helicase/nuclease subunit A